jgi:transcriptional regulator NrdR family protein
MTTAKLCCPSCGQFESKVVNVRPTKTCETVWRRRECAHCRARFTTEERIVPTTRPTEKAHTYNI